MLVTLQDVNMGGDDKDPLLDFNMHGCDVIFINFNEKKKKKIMN